MENQGPASPAMVQSARGPALRWRDPESRGRMADQQRSRQGLITMEVIMILFLLVLVTFAVFQFTVAMMIKQTVVHATTVGAREAAKDPDIDELVDIVEKVLAAHSLEIGADASIVLEDPADPMTPVQQRGGLTCDPPSVPLLEPDEVRVTICVSLTAASFMNPLKSYGSDFTGKTFTISSVAKKE